jgi:hypothetical protein
MCNEEIVDWDDAYEVRSSYIIRQFGDAGLDILPCERMSPDDTRTDGIK